MRPVGPVAACMPSSTGECASPFGRSWPIGRSPHHRICSTLRRGWSYGDNEIIINLIFYYIIQSYLEMDRRGRGGDGVGVGSDGLQKML